MRVPAAEARSTIKQPGVPLSDVIFHLCWNISPSTFNILGGMEDPPLFDWKNWSTFRKGQIIAGATGAFVTIASWIPIGILFGKYSSVSEFLFQFGFLLLMPTWAICKAAGIEGAAQLFIGGQFLFVALEVIINSFICVIVATLIGGLVREITKPLKRKRP